MLRKLYTDVHGQHHSRVRKMALTALEVPRVTQETAARLIVQRKLAQLHDGDGHGVMVLPGFVGHDNFNTPLIRFLNRIGYRATGWQQGINLGPRPNVLASLFREVDYLYRLSGAKISLVGHSLGGIYAREIARRSPERIRQVITLASPFADPGKRKSASRHLYERLNRGRQHLDRNPILLDVPPVPNTSVYTRSDSVIDWRWARQEQGHEHSENVEVYASHCGMTQSASVWYLLADRLQNEASDWRHFDNSGWRQWVFPHAESAHKYQGEE